MKGWTFLGYYVVGLFSFALMMVLSFFLGRCTAEKCSDNIIEQNDTVVVRDTVRIEPEHLPVQVVTQEVVRYKYVPVTVTDTLVERDTIIQVKDGIASIPITRKTYTDSATYKAVVSGYDPQLESMEVYRENLVVTRWKQKHWRIGVGGAAGVSVVTGKPDITIGLMGGYTF